MCKQVPLKISEESIAILFKNDLNLYDVNYFHPSFKSMREFMCTVHRCDVAQGNGDSLFCCLHGGVNVDTKCISVQFGKNKRAP